VFDKLSVMVRLGYVKTLIKFCVRGFDLVSFIVLESLIKFYELVWRLAPASGLNLVVSST